MSVKSKSSVQLFSNLMKTYMYNLLKISIRSRTVEEKSNCQAQPQLQVKLSLKAELALISLNPVYLEANMNLAKLRLDK